SPQGSRITGMTLLKTGEPIDPARSYVVSGWASVNEGTEGPPIWQVVEDYVKRQGTVRVDPNKSVVVSGA
ncbi:5'-nucleotidase C-terminal domain-containing protein, partial [Rhodovulum sulfidophilum]|nr:5'-nucleotidase C-terminal domain-containing protein [Rhodovulum sulfidophilum]